MHRCYLDPSQWKPDTIDLPRDESHHLLNVLRAEEGDPVTIVDGQGGEAEAVISSVSGHTVTLKIRHVGRADRPEVPLTLVQALPKGRRMDLIVEKCTELGVAEIRPVITERTVTRLKPSQYGARHERWLRVARSAAKQCGTTWLPDIKPVTTYADSLSGLGDNGALMIGTLEPDTVPFPEAIHDVKRDSPSGIAFVVGPEGDLTADEVQAARALGGKVVSFGELVLRVETAAIYAMSVLSYEFARGVR